VTAAIPAPTDLLGTWTLTRTVHDRWAGERRAVTGTATLLAESPDRVRWTEAGTMTWPGHTVEVQRTLVVERGADGWLVRFEDGRPFHPWSVGAEVEHPCAPDHYRGRIDVTGHPVSSWTVTWDAVGPGKDYRMETAYDARR
jgi:hypothetical protein